MFWTIKKQKEKRLPINFESYLRPRVFEKGKWVYEEPIRFAIGGIDATEPVFIGKVDGSPIPRDLRWKLVVELNRSVRVGKNVVKKTVLSDVIRYWEVIDCEFLDDAFHYAEGIYERIDRSNLTIHEISGADLYRQLEIKLEPYISEIIEHYKTTPEYRWMLQNNELRAAYIPKDKAKKEAYDKKKQRQGANGYHFGTDFHRVRSVRGISDKEREIIEAGYRALSKKYHPDVGGSRERFVELGKIKDKMLGK